MFGAVATTIVFMFDRPWIHDIVLLLLRATLALVVGAQGYQIFFDHGVSKSAEVLEKWSMPSSYPLTVLMGICFCLCAVGVFLGLLTPLFAVIGAFAEGVYTFYLITGGHYDITTSATQMSMLVIVALVTLAVLGAGRISADEFLNHRV